MTGPVPQPTPAPVSGVPQGVGEPQRAGRLRNRRARLIVAMLAGFVALLCTGGVGVAISLYDDATQIKRTAPDAVVDNFLGAYLVNRDDREAALYECKTGGDFSQIQAYRANIASREKEFSVGIVVSWSSLDVAISGDKGTVTTELIRTVTDQSGRDSDSWQFAVVDQSGWRVCGATRLP